MKVFEGVSRVRFVSSLFIADIDVYEDPLFIKYERIKKNFDKQFALKLKVKIKQKDFSYFSVN